MKISCPKLLGSSSSPCKMKRKKEKQKAEIDARAAEVYTCGPCCRSAGFSFRCSVPIAQREWSLWKLLLRFPFLLSEPSALVGGSGLRMVKRTPSLEVLRRDRTAGGDDDEWSEILKKTQGILVGSSLLNHFSLMQYLYTANNKRIRGMGCYFSVLSWVQTALGILDQKLQAWNQPKQIASCMRGQGLGTRSSSAQG